MNLLLFKVWISYDKRRWGASFLNLRFENDVKTYGIQTHLKCTVLCCQFENDVKTYGIQTFGQDEKEFYQFENDVKTYGIQTYNIDTDTAF